MLNCNFLQENLVNTWLKNSINNIPLRKPELKYFYTLQVP
jgi:hypothetical protein